MKSLDDVIDNRVSPLVLIDSMNTVYRYYYGLRLNDSKGYSTGVLYGVLKLICELNDNYNNVKIIFFWEGINSRRKSIDSDYKANRERTGNELSDCIKELKIALQYMNVEQVFHVGLEADDLIGYYVNHNKKRKKIIIISNDKDISQYSGDNIVIRKGSFNSSRTFDYNFSELEESLGFPPNKIVLFKALTGDKSDNIKGIERFPRKLAIEMAKSCNIIEDFKIYDYPIKMLKWKTKIEEEWYLIERNNELIKYHAEWIHSDEIENIPHIENKKELRKLLLKREIVSLVDRLKL